MPKKNGAKQSTRSAVEELLNLPDFPEACYPRPATSSLKIFDLGEESSCLAGFFQSRFAGMTKVDVPRTCTAGLKNPGMASDAVFIDHRSPEVITNSHDLRLTAETCHLFSCLRSRFYSPCPLTSGHVFCTLRLHRKGGGRMQSSDSHSCSRPGEVAET